MIIKWCINFINISKIGKKKQNNLIDAAINAETCKNDA